MSSIQSKIGIGTVQFGLNYGISNMSGKTPSYEVEKILKYAANKRIQYIDTAYAYGVAEKVLGQFDLSNFRVVSKFILKDGIGLVEQLESSLNNLQVNSLYGYLAHRPLELLINDSENLKTLHAYKSKGVIQKIGASFNSIDEIQMVLDRGVDLDIIQVPYNYLDRRFERLMIELRSKGCEIHTRSTFLQGLFFCDVEKLDPFFDEIKCFLKQIQEFPDLSAELLSFVLEKDFVDVVNIGVNNLLQFEENVTNIKEEGLRLCEINYTSINDKILMPSEWPK